MKIIFFCCSCDGFYHERAMLNAAARFAVYFAIKNNKM